MNPITPQRFIELMEKTDKRYIKLWHSELDEYFEIKYIWKTDPYVWEGKAYEGGSYLLSKLYESKPETPLDELNEIIEYIGRQPAGDNNGLEYDKLSHFRTKYESQLKEMK